MATMFPPRLLVVFPALLVLGIGWILCLVDFSIAVHHANYEGEMNGAHLTVSLPYWIFTLGVPVLSSFVLWDAFSTSPFIGVLIRSLAVGCGIALGGCLTTTTQRVFFSELVPSIGAVGVPIAGLTGGLLCAFSLVTLIGVSPYLVNIVLYLLGEARRSQKEPRELKLPGDAQRKVQFSDM